MSQSTIDAAGRFVIGDYQRGKPFASFLPGIAGLEGSPLWVFYVNRGQAIAGFGVESKDNPIMEFLPANKAYQSVPYSGFRTFLKMRRGGAETFYEPFALPRGASQSAQVMHIGANDLLIEDTSEAAGIQTTVLYFNPPGETFASLVRVVTVRNLGSEPVSLDVLDGLPAVIPYGVNNFLLKELGRTCEAWMEVYRREEKAPFYRLRASVIDREEVETFSAGHFAFAAAGGERLPALVDPTTVFGPDTSFTYPHGFAGLPLEALLAAPQVTCGRTPCGMFAHSAALGPGESFTLYSLYGHIASPELLDRHLPRLERPAFFEQKHREAAALAEEITALVETCTADPLFDAYVKQNFLDNVLRGGLPVMLGGGENRKPYYVYSRKHGDLERDYNAFFIAPEPYSQGEGSYRDVNQNRRDSVLFAPEIGDFDIRTFMSLIQSDGYNPRTVRGSTFTLSAAARADVLAGIGSADGLETLLSHPFTPGKLVKFIAEHGVRLPVTPARFLNDVIARSEQHLEAAFFEGYWIDHWEYNLDLVENYLAVFPDRREALLFGGEPLPFFESPVFVQPRAKKYVLTAAGPRQIGSLLEDGEKARRIAARAEHKDWMRSKHGEGPVYRCSLFAKMTLVTLLKFAALDPWGMGIAMEAGRPGWCDALNGMPAVFGSGMSETYELLRWVRFLKASLAGQGSVKLPVEAAGLLSRINHQLEVYESSKAEDRQHACWDAISSALERYREQTRFGVSGGEEDLSFEELRQCLAAFDRKISEGASRAEALNHGVPPTYLTYRMDEYEELPEKDPQGRPYLKAKRFTPHVMPLYLEGPVRAYKVLDEAASRALYAGVRASDLFDAKLKMYKINASIEGEPHDIGRARAFPRGWLENESIWMHMEYKYLLEVLKAGLYTEFFADLREAIPPFLDPAVYGRSTLENSSFIASSAHPDPAMHGAGFVARLTGSTAEFISMWNIMMAGRQPFVMKDGALCLELRPALPGWMFTGAGEVTFRFLGRCTVTYHNPARVDTFAPGCAPKRITLHPAGASLAEIEGAVIGAPYAEQVRAGEIERIDVYF